MSTFRAAALAVLLTLPLLIPATAQAGSVTAGTGLAFTEAPNEPNRVWIRQVDAYILFSDTIITEHTNGRCRAFGHTTVDCALEPAPARIEADLGGDDDRLTLGPLPPWLPASVDGGVGADRLDAATATGSAQLSGGPGADVLVGGSEAALTTFLMGAAADGADTVIGGAGFDVASYAERQAPLTITLDGLPNDGEANEGDAIGDGVDALIGGARADVLGGDAGSQRLTGGAGNDTIDPGGGSDDVLAGDGSDTIRARDGSPDWVACGPGDDTLIADHDDVADACEAVDLPPAPPAADTRKPVVKLRGLPSRPRYRHLRRGLRLRLSADEPVSYVVELLGGRRRAGSTRFNVVLARRDIRLTATERRITLRPRRALLGRRRAMRVRIRVTATDAAGNQSITRSTLRVRR